MEEEKRNGEAPRRSARHSWFFGQKKLPSLIYEQLPPSGVHSSDEESDLPARLQGIEQKVDLE